MPTNLFTPFTLPNGQLIKNRLVKAAMEENMANAFQLPDSALFNLYQAWAEGGVGLIITGNVMVDHLAMTGPGGVVLEQQTPLAAFETLASKAKANDTKLWMQINHPGRQVFKRMGGKVLSPSDIALNMGKHSGLFSQPKPMNEEEIEDVIARFVTTARRAHEAGFDGVEVHAAHGYLLSQFLSPLTNQRRDQWGGSLENRARLLLTIIDRIQTLNLNNFAIAVKLNSADFQRGGFDTDDALQVVKWLEEKGIDMVELSGGSYEAPAMQGQSGDARTLAREAYFLAFAEKIAQQTSLPVMTTGGIKRLEVAEKVLNSGMAMVGMASALAYDPQLPNHWQQGIEQEGVIPNTQWKDKTLKGLANMALVKRQLRRLGKGKAALKKASPIFTLIIDQLRTAKLTKRYKQRFASEVK